MHRLLRVFATAMFFVFAGGTAFAAAPEGGSGDRAEPAASEAPLVIFNRTIFVFRATLMGASPPSARHGHALLCWRYCGRGSTSRFRSKTTLRTTADRRRLAGVRCCGSRRRPAEP